MAAWNPEANAIFLNALELESIEERGLYLEAACAGSAELRAQVDALLDAGEKAGSFLESPAAEVTATANMPSREGPGVIIGPYKLLQQIGEGGMGAVWMAQQTEPVKRVVALKLIKAGMDSKQVIARFEAERQALALMDHPNIARVLDGGTTDAGRPYFVMDLVKGVPITKYCDEHHLTPRQRLELFVPVCQAIQHAHQKGIIHRDLKPSNVLVALYDGKPVPKVIDFGVAKATGQQLTEKTLDTGFGALVGTLEYMSPEQAEINQLDIDTRSDIYSLGVLLYELLTGSPPFTKKDLEKAGMLEMLRVIREQEPSKPSTKLSTADGLPTLAANRGTEPAKLTRLLRGELDWVVMKALEKDRGRRYETANGFAMDVQRYLNYEPVQAHPPSAWYQLRKFVPRNKAALLAATMAALAILIPSGIGLWLAAERSARQKATERAVDDALENAGVLLAQEKWRDATAIAQRAEWRLNEGGGSAQLRGRVRQLLADLDMVARLEEVRLKYWELTTRGYDFVASDAAYAAAFQAYGIDVLALEPAEAAQRIRASAIHPSLVAAIDDWTWVRSATGIHGHKHLRAVARFADADVWRNRLRDAAERGDTKLLEDLTDHPDVVSQPPSTLVVLGRTLLWNELTSDAPQPLSALTWAKVAKMLEAAQLRHPDDFGLNLLLNSALLFRTRQPQPEMAAGYCRAALAVRPKSQSAYNALAGCLVRIPGRVDEAIDAYHKAIELNPEYAGCHNWLGKALAKKGAWDEAIAAYRQAIRLDPKAAEPHANLAWAYRNLLAPEKAIAEYQRAVSLDPEFWPAWRELSLVLANCADPQLRDPASALSAANKAVARAPREPLCWFVLGVARYRNGDVDGAITALQKSLENSSAGANQNPHIWVFLAMAHAKQGNKEQAQEWYDRTVRWMDGMGQRMSQNRLLQDDFSRLRAEAAELLGKPSQAPPGKEVLPEKP
jgi:serine/threonine protein kinase/Flp pilus assembly protein TadD